MATTELRELFRSLPDNLREDVYEATKEVIDERAGRFGNQLTATMNIGTRQYPFANVHTNTKVATKEKIETRQASSLIEYGWKFLYNGMGYKDVTWNTHYSSGRKIGNGHQVPFDLVANVTSGGRHKRIFVWNPPRHRKDGSLIVGSMGGNYEGTEFINKAVHTQLIGMDDAINTRFEELSDRREA